MEFAQLADPMNLPTGISYEAFDMTAIQMKEFARMEGLRIEEVGFIHRMQKIVDGPAVDN